MSYTFHPDQLPRTHPLNTVWEREFHRYKWMELESVDTGRELLVFEGESHIIRALKNLTEGFEVPEP